MIDSPYIHGDGITLYNAEALSLLRQLSIDDVEFHAVITDPPYSSGGAFRGDRCGLNDRDKYQLSGTTKTYPAFGGDNRDQRSFGYWCVLWLSECLRLSVPGAPIVVFSDWRQLPTLTDALQAAGWVWRGVAVWDKTEGARPAKGRYRNQCEFLVWGSNGPLAVMREVVKIAWRPDSVILDPFAGSGTTLLAARENGQKAVGIEMSAEYCDVAKRRLSQSVMSFSQ